MPFTAWNLAQQNSLKIDSIANVDAKVVQASKRQQLQVLHTLISDIAQTAGTHPVYTTISGASADLDNEDEEALNNMVGDMASSSDDSGLLVYIASSTSQSDDVWARLSHGPSFVIFPKGGICDQLIERLADMSTIPGSPGVRFCSTLEPAACLSSNSDHPSYLLAQVADSHLAAQQLRSLTL